MLHRVQGLEFLKKKVLKLAQQFSRPRKSLENGYKVYKNGKSLFLIFFFKATTSVILQQVLYESHFFCFDQILLNLAHTSTFAAHHEKSFVPAFFKVSVDHLFDNLESGKRNNKLFGKKSGQSLKFWIQKSVQILCAPLHFD